MYKEKILRYLPWGLAIFIAVIFVQSLFFKFTNSFETQHIFGEYALEIARAARDMLGGNGISER